MAHLYRTKGKFVISLIAIVYIAILCRSSHQHESLCTQSVIILERYTVLYTASGPGASFIYCQSMRIGYPVNTVNGFIHHENSNVATDNLRFVLLYEDSDHHIGNPRPEQFMARIWHRSDVTIIGGTPAGYETIVIGLLPLQQD